jgi:hypothetical protein
MLSYSPSTRGFYQEGFHAPTSIPADVVEITAEEYAALLQAQAQGLVIQPGEGGRPEAVERVLTLAEETAARIAQIQAELTAIDAASARPLRAVLAAQNAGVTPDQDDVDRLASLEAQALDLRAELAGLEG